MPLVITPGQLQRQAEFYRQFGTLLQAGIPVMQALQHLQRHPPDRNVGRQARQLLASLENSATLTGAFRALKPPVPAFDSALIEAGEQSGRLDAVFQMVAEQYELRSQIARSTISELLYPAFLAHFAVFIFPFAEFFNSGNLARYLFKTLGILLPLYAVILALLYASRSTHNESWRARMERLLHAVPVLGQARHKLALARLAAALQALLDAGVPVVRAWELAAEASASPALRREISQWPPELAAGRTPAELVQASPRFPRLFASLYSGGEVSGKLDQELRHLQFLLREESNHLMKQFWSWVPKIIYLVIAIIIAYKVVAFYISLYSVLDTDF